MGNASTRVLFHAFLLAGFAIGCTSTQVTSVGGANMSAAMSEPYDGPKARIAVADFEDKTTGRGYYRSEYGRGLADMLVTNLFTTNRFIVLEREKIDAVLAEQDFGGSGRVRADTAAPVGDIEGADLLVTAAITGFDPGTTGGSAALDQVPFGSMLRDASGAFQKAHIAMDLRVVSARSGRVVHASSVQGSATGFSGGGSFLGGTLGGGLSGFAKTPMETAIRAMIRRATEEIVTSTPANFRSQ